MSIFGLVVEECVSLINLLHVKMPFMYLSKSQDNVESVTDKRTIRVPSTR